MRRQLLDHPVARAIEVMAFEGAHRLVVLDGKRLVGIVRTMDVMRELAGFPRHGLRVVGSLRPVYRLGPTDVWSALGERPASLRFGLDEPPTAREGAMRRAEERRRRRGPEEPAAIDVIRAGPAG